MHICTHTYKTMGGELQESMYKTSPLPCVLLSLPSCLFPKDVIYFWKSSQTPQCVICYNFICCFKSWTLGRKTEMLLIVSRVSGELSMWKVVWTVWFSFLKLPIRPSLCKQLRCAMRNSGELKLRCLKRLFHSCRECRNWFGLVYTDDPSVCLKPLWSTPAFPHCGSIANMSSVKYKSEEMKNHKKENRQRVCCLSVSKWGTLPIRLIILLLHKSLPVSTIK